MQHVTEYDIATLQGLVSGEPEAHLSFEPLLTDIAAKFVNVPLDQIDASIMTAQKRICEHLGIDRCVLWQFNAQAPGKIWISHVHDASTGFLPEAPFDARKTFPWILARIQRGQNVIVEHTDDLPREARHDRQSMRQWGIKSTFVTPLWLGGEIDGALSFGSLKQEMTWNENLVKRLQLVAQLFSNALSRKLAEERLTARRRFESLVSDISAQFINLPADRIDAEIEDAQRLICECLGVDLSSLWQWSDKAPHSMVLTHLHSPPPPLGPIRPDYLDAKEAFPWKLEQLMKGELVACTTKDLPPEANRDIESSNTYGIKSSIAIPLSTGGDPLVGVLSFDDLRVERSWSEAILQRLSVVAQIFANALARKRWELKLRESEYRLATATDAADVGLWAFEIESRYLWASAKARELFHFGQDETLNYKNIIDVIHPSDRQRVKKAMRATIRSGEKLDIECRILAPDGSIRWLRMSGKRILGGYKKSVRIKGASVEVTDRKHLENQLRTQLEEIKDLKQRLEKENIVLRKEIELQHSHEEIIGRSPTMQQILSQVEQVARTDATALIEGETGTGKELLARAVHRLSKRRDRPLVTVNCASLPPTLVESELFGREKGAYTGALTRMAGRFEMADKATLFLDEIGELPIDVQAKLLRVLEQGHFERLGSTKSIRVDVRLIAATNQDLSVQVAEGRFRKDLYFRLNVFPITLPPLRERAEDIPPLVWHFVRRFEGDMGRRIDAVPRQCMDALQRYAWPGNIRELRNVIERAMITSNDRVLDVHPPSMGASDVPENFELEEAERRHIQAVLRQTGWRLSGKGGAAEFLGLKRTTLYSKMKKLGIQRPTH